MGLCLYKTQLMRQIRDIKLTIEIKLEAYKNALKDVSEIFGLNRIDSFTDWTDMYWTYDYMDVSGNKLLAVGYDEDMSDGVEYFLDVMCSHICGNYALVYAKIKKDLDYRYYLLLKENGNENI